MISLMARFVVLMKHVRGHKLLALALLSIWFTTSTHAVQAQKQKPNSAGTASLRDTLTWLRDRIATDGGWRANGREYSYEPDFSSCTVKWTFLVNRRPDSRTSFSLADIDPKNVITDDAPGGEGDYAVVLRTKNLKHSIKDETPVLGTSMTEGMNIIFRDKSIADRVTKAIIHAATLCAKEPF